MTDEKTVSPIAVEKLKEFIKLAEQTINETTLTDLYYALVFGAETTDNITILISFIIDMFRSAAMLNLIPKFIVQDILDNIKHH
jgi:hypothetical protein